MAEESKLEAHFRLEVRKLGGMAEKVMPTNKGMPDRMVIIAGRIYLVELKARNGRLSLAQKVWHDKAAECGVKVFTLAGRAHVDQWLEGLNRAISE